METQRVDGLSVVAIALIIFMLFRVFSDFTTGQAASTTNTPEENNSPQETAVQSPSEPQEKHEAVENTTDPQSFAAPYDRYVLTQGLHGYSYGHMAIDIAAGKGAEIKSPIHGIITESYVDEYGNPTLVIENDFYRVTMLHGEYDVEVGDQLDLGEVVGEESNLGYTTDMQGNSCRGRNCGYHTHLNVFDKRLGTNINPLDLLD